MSNRIHHKAVRFTQSGNTLEERRARRLLLFTRKRMSLVSPMPAGFVARFEGNCLVCVTQCPYPVPSPHPQRCSQRSYARTNQPTCHRHPSTNARQGNVSDYFDMFASSLIQNVGFDGHFISWISTSMFLNRDCTLSTRKMNANSESKKEKREFAYI